MEDRRRAERQPAVWMGACHVDGDPSDLVPVCGVFDFSALGVGMDFRHPDGVDIVGRGIAVNLPVGDSLDITLTGQVRNAKAGPDGVVRAGIEFSELSEEELYIVDLLELESMSSTRV
jgi:hypothetical protein